MFFCERALATQVLAFIGLTVIVASAAGQVAKAPAPSGPRIVSRTPAARASILGAAFSPANFPGSSDADVSQFFDLAAQLGSQVTVISAWKDRTPVDVLRQIEARTHEKGMRFVLYLDPVALDSNRTRAAVPPGVPGASFRDASVRTAYTADALALVALRPDILGLGTEINLLAENSPEFDAYLSLMTETVRAIKSRSPGQAVTVSFQWDFMLIQKKFDPLIGPLDASDREGSMIFSNHSCEPNLGVAGQVIFVALRDIEAGEELTHDWAMTDDDASSMECRCGAPTCRKTVTGQDWRRRDLQEKYRGFFSWYLEQKIRAASADSG